MKFSDFNTMSEVQFEEIENRLRTICDEDEYEVFMLLLLCRKLAMYYCEEEFKMGLLLNDFRTDWSVADVLDSTADDDYMTPYEILHGIVKLMSRGFISGYKDSKTELEKIKFEPAIIDKALAGELSQTDAEECMRHWDLYEVPEYLPASKSSD